MQNIIVSVKYEDKYNSKTFSGKAYSYFSSLKLEVGDIVEAPTKFGNSIARVSKINIPEERIEYIKPYMKVITKKLNKQSYLNENKILEDVA